MTRKTSNSVYFSNAFFVFIAAMVLLAIAGGYQLSQLFSQVNDSAAKRSIQLLVIEESLDDAAIGLGRQIQEWKDMLLRANNKELYEKHQKAFKESSIGVQYALLNAKTSMRDIGMGTAEIDQLIIDHKSLLSEYLLAYSNLKPTVEQSSNMVDMRIIGVDRKLQHEIDLVKSDISVYAKLQLNRDPQTQGSRLIMIGLLGALSLSCMALFGFVTANFIVRP